MLLCTLDDYAVEVDLDGAIYEEFRAKNRELAKAENKPLIVLFEEALMPSIEE